VTGALYYRTTTPIGMKVYDGAQWIEASAQQQAALVTYEYVATAGQTTFSGADANSLTLSYIAGGLIVSLNGVILRPGDDYTATNGTSIVLASGAAAGDEVVAYAFNSFDIANTYTQAQTDTLLAAKANTSDVNTALAGKQDADAQLTTLAGASADRATFLASANDFTFRNRIINGDMRIDQRNAGASVSGFFSYAVDRFNVGQTSGETAAFTQQRDTDVPQGAGFTNSLRFTVTTPQTTFGTDQRVEIRQRVEGFNVADLGFGGAGASPVTLSFWVRSSLSGVFGGSILNGAGNRSYPFSYTISTANTWEYKSVTIPGDTTGTWAKDNSSGMTVSWCLGGNASRLGTPGVWAAASFIGASGQVNLMGTNGATFYITGVQLEAGSVATPFERRPYGTELVLCQRYFEQSTEVQEQFMLFKARETDRQRIGTIQYKVTKRATPTIVLLGANGDGGGTPAASAIGTYACRMTCISTADGQGPWVNGYSAAAEL
jgi:hypothetical protein